MIYLIGLMMIGQLDHFGFASINSPQMVGDSFSVTIFAYDASNQVVTTYNGHPWVYSSLGPTYGLKQVSFFNGTCTENMLVTLASNMYLICNDYSGHTGNSNAFLVTPNVPAKLLSIVPNETYQPGTQTGKIGSAAGQTAGVQFNLQVYLTDAWYNTIDTTDHTLNFASSDPFAQQGQLAMTNGTASMSFAFRTAGTRRLYFSDASNSAIKRDTSAAIAVYPGSYSRLLVVLPGETHLPGDTTSAASASPGVSGDPNEQYILEDFQLSVFATDTMWNLTNTSGNQIELSSPSQFTYPGPENLSDGEVQFSLNFSSSGETYIMAHDLSTNYWSNPSNLSVTSRARNLDISVNPDTISPGLVADISATVFDLNGQPIEGKLVSFSVVTGNGYIVSPYENVYTNSLGQCTSHFTATTGFFNEVDTIVASADGYAESTVCYVVIPDSSVMEGDIVAYPNPFGRIGANTTQFIYYLQQNCNAILAVFDPFGNLVHREDISAGQNGGRVGINILQWNGRNDKGRRVASGVYYVVVKGYMHTSVFLEKRLKVGVIW